MGSSIAPFAVDFDLRTGMCKSEKEKPTYRYVSNMVEQFHDQDAAREIAKNGDQLLYAFYELNQIPETSGELKFGTSIVYPGLVGDEYFMTKGHFHTILDTAEVYYCLSGEGYMLMETPEGDVRLEKLEAGVALYVPPRYAHRSINTGDVPLVTFFTFRSDAGHDYGTIEQKGYRNLLVKRNDQPTLVENPAWK